MSDRSPRREDSLCRERKSQKVDHAAPLTAALGTLLQLSDHAFLELLGSPTDVHVTVGNHYIRLRSLRCRGMPETSCGVDPATGEIKCDHARPPHRLDCRQPFCSHQIEMRRRTAKRLRQVLAKSANKLAEL